MDNNIQKSMSWIILMAVFILQLLVYTWCRVQCVNVGYEISRETEDYHKQLTIQNTLKIELERLRSPERIARIAKYQLGLITPEEHQKISIVSEQ